MNFVGRESPQENTLSEVHLKSTAPLLHSNSTHMTVDCIAAAIAYLLGSIPFGYLLVWLFRKEDIRETGSGNIGATNVLRTGSRWLGVLTLLLDIGKGFLAVEIARRLTTGQHAIEAGAIAALFAVIGHVFPVWLRGKGGKGVATALGVFLALASLAAWSALAVFIVVTALTRYVSLASMLAAASFPVWVWLGERFLGIDYGSGVIFLASTILVPAVILIKHRKNIDRLLHGTEFRFGSKESDAA
ncbi:MAG: glycerol-3-phosphate 1-O-acyltransferase PlsY [Sulfobacillus sp.]